MSCILDFMGPEQWTSSSLSYRMAVVMLKFSCLNGDTIGFILMYSVPANSQVRKMFLVF